jgi:hypothetical protein
MPVNSALVANHKPYSYILRNISSIFLIKLFQTNVGLNKRALEFLTLIYDRGFLLFTKRSILSQDIVTPFKSTEEL